MFTTTSPRRRTRWFGVPLAAALLTSSILIGPAPAASAISEFDPLPSPRRILDTRPTGTTYDGRSAGGGARSAGSTLTLAVAGRVDVPADATSVVLNVTAVNPRGNGFVTVHPCGTTRPNASNLNVRAGVTVANTVVARIGDNGSICVYTSTGTDLVADVVGNLPGSSFEALPVPRRVLDTRPDGTTHDGASAGGGRRGPGSTVSVTVAGRAGIAADASAVVLNVTAANPAGNGFVTVFPCGTTRPNASNLNVTAGTTLPNAAVARVGDGGAVCIFTSVATDLVVDAAGVLPVSTYLPLASPRRLLDTRPGFGTHDGQFVGAGTRAGGSTLTLPIAGRAGIPESASAVVLNVTAVAPRANGFVTVHPRGSSRPNASNLNGRAGVTIANTVVTRLGSDGSVCLYTSAATDLVVDVAGVLAGPMPPASGGGCPGPAPAPAPSPSPPPTPTPTPGRTAGTYLVNAQMAPGRWVAEHAGRGCYWARLNGLGGSLGEIEANDFIPHPGRVIVDVLPSDLAFSFDSDCGTFRPYSPVSTRASTIVPGDHVVGQHIVPGVYSANASRGCYWARLRTFDGQLRSIIANDFVASAGPQLVEVGAGDVGFYTDADCGTWTKIG